MKAFTEVLPRFAAIAALLSLAAEPIWAQGSPAGSTRPQIQRPATLPAARPVRPPLRPPVNRPTTLPSYPDRPQAERPQRPVRPPIYRPGYVNWGYHSPGGGRYFADTIRCDSFNGRFRSCYARTQGRVVLEKRHNGRCRYGRGWGFDRNRIWVDHSCRATFAYGYGNYVPRYRSDSNDTALIIGGVVVAAGLLAILGRSGGSKDGLPQQASARIDADLDKVRASARPALQTCLDRAASNVAATGGTSIKLTSVTIDVMDDSIYRFDADTQARYPDKLRNLSFSCTAGNNQIEDFDFITESTE